MQYICFNANSKHERYLLIMICLAIGIFQFYTMARLISGDFLNSYPFVSDDGFDWVAQGLALEKLLFFNDFSTWPVLRPPFFVFITFLDALFGANGYLIIGFISLSTSATLLAITYLAVRLQFSLPTIFFIILAAWLYNLAYFRSWILSDAVCIALMMWSLVLVLGDKPAQIKERLLVATSFAVLAGITQTYGVIPFITTTIVFAAFGFWRRDFRNAFRYALATVFALALVGMLQLGWGAVIPHAMRPSNFALLELSFDMLGFYSGVWPWAFAVFCPALALLVMRRETGTWFEPGAVALLICLLVFALLTFFYQWPEARFTYLYWSIALAFILVVSRLPSQIDNSRIENTIRSTCLGVVGIALLLVPGQDYWRPTVRFASVDWYGTWFANLLLSKPVDRFLLEASCGDSFTWCISAPVENYGSDYVKAVMKEFRRRKIAMDE